VGLDIGDVRFAAEGIELTLRCSKDDRLGRRAVVRIQRGKGLATCPVKALSVWIGRVGRPACT